jgi:hypothetical protein
MSQEHVDRLLEHWSALDPDEATPALGGAWYAEAKRTARALSRKHGVKVSVAAGVLAATSPRQRWASNVGITAALLEDPLAPVPCFAANVAKARRIIAGEAPLSVLGGDKVRAFYRAIMGDQDAAVVDVWMFRAMGVVAGGIKYAEAEAALREAAASVGITVSTFQATVWVKVRGSAE